MGLLEGGGEQVCGPARGRPGAAAAAALDARGEPDGCRGIHLESCQHILGQLAEAEGRLRADHVAPAGLLRVSAPPGLLSLHPRLVSSFLAQHPGVTLDLDLTHRMVDLVEERIDVALRMTAPRDASLVARRLAPAPRVVVASPAWLAANGTPDTPAALARFPCIQDTNFRFHPRWPFRVGGQRFSVEVSGPVRVNSPLLVRDLVLEGAGIGLIHALLVAEELRSGRLVALFDGQVDTDWSIYAITSQRRHLSSRTRAFLQHVHDYFAATAG